MNVVLAVIIGVLYAAAFYMLLRRSLVRVLLGLAFLSHASNLLVFSAPGLRRYVPPIVPVGETVAPAGSADPVSQALTLTAIVISFGVLAFALVLAFRFQDAERGDDVEGR